MPLNCPQVVSKLKAYQKQHQDLKQQFSDLMSQVPFLLDVKWDEPFMSSPYYKDITNAPKDIFDNLYDAKEKARKKLEEMKDEIGYQKPLTEKEFSKLTWNNKLESIYSRCFKPTQYPNQELQYQQPIPDLRRHELKFLYDYYRSKDKKYQKIITQRDKKADMLRIFDCAPDQIAHNQQELQQAVKDKKEIKVYIGGLFPNIFKLLPHNIEHIYTEFPGKKIKQTTIKLGIGPQSKEDLILAIEKKQMSGLRKIMSNANFSFNEKERDEKIIILSVRELGFSQDTSLEKIFSRAKGLGLDLCPPEIGPLLFFQTKLVYCLIAMEPIPDSHNNLHIFDILPGGHESRFDVDRGEGNALYDCENPFAFVCSNNT